MRHGQRPTGSPFFDVLLFSSFSIFSSSFSTELLCGKFKTEVAQTESRSLTNWESFRNKSLANWEIQQLASDCC
jgi:hypothetical protein